MSLPGPAFGPWALALLLGAAALLPVGELVRRLAARRSRWARTLRPIERLVVDLYLGGGVLFGIAALPLGLFYSLTPGLVILGSVGLLALLLRYERREGRPAPNWAKLVGGFRSPPILIVLATALALFLIELWTASQAPTGNTFDSSVLTYFVAHLGLQHSIPLNFLPAAPFGNPYPQGTTVWLASYQDLFGLPPARTSLLVTPLFLGLGPLGAYTVGDRLLGTPRAGATVAVVFAFVGSWTRVLVGGSNDFVFAFPLLLVLFARIPDWTTSDAPGWADAVFFGALAGVVASLNPAGPIWLFLAIFVDFVLAGPARWGRWAGWIARWSAALVVGALFAIPSLFEEVTGANGLFHAGVPPGAVVPTAGSGGITAAQFVGLTDPFLFRGTDVWLSPFPPIRDELAVLIGVGAIALIAAQSFPVLLDGLDRLRKTAISGGAVAFGILGAGLAAHSGWGGLRPFLALTSFAETSILLFSVYTMVAAAPLWVLVRYTLERFRRPSDLRSDSSAPAPSATTHGGAPPSRGWITPTLALAAALLVVGPGIAVTAGELPAYEGGLYEAFGNVTPADLDLLIWAGSHLGAGDRILVAPGSAAGFLPGYVPSAIVLFPMVDGVFVNGSYRLLVQELTNATLDAAGVHALRVLQVGFVAVTGNNSQLYRPFSPDPFLGDPTFREVFHEQDAYLFQWTPIVPLS
ncbi:MAG TPA: hypothetical protein VGX00_06005 [Thermoplasmata archaeon]|nr:hypothetical protein [Thermoplasmata archaeon]